MRHILTFRSALLIATLGCASVRQGPPASIPLPLASALIDGRDGSSSRSAYSVGTLPAGYPATLIPGKPARIVGGMSAGDQITVVFDDSTRRLAAVMEQVFEQHGYARPPATPGSGFSSASGPYSFFCGDSGTVSVDPLSGANRTSARVTYRRGAMSGFCRRRNEPPPSRAELKLPELKPLPGGRVTSSHGGSGSGGVSSQAEIVGTDLDPAAAVAHYAAQLVSAGWTTDTPALSQRLAAQYFEAKDSGGAAWEGVLMAVGTKEKLTVSLSMEPRIKR